MGLSSGSSDCGVWRRVPNLGMNAHLHPHSHPHHHHHREVRQVQEITFRVNAAKEAWSTLGGCWQKSGTSKRARINGLILSTLKRTMVMSIAEYKTIGCLHSLFYSGTQCRTLSVQEQWRSTCVQQVVCMQDLHCCIVWQVPF